MTKRMSLEELIEEAAKRNLLEILTLYNRSGWQANARNMKGSWTCISGEGPSVGLEKAVRGLFGLNQPDGQVVEEEDEDGDIFA